jgi:hypothetical protein
MNAKAITNLCFIDVSKVRASYHPNGERRILVSSARGQVSPQMPQISQIVGAGGHSIGAGDHSDGAGGCPERAVVVSSDQMVISTGASSQPISDSSSVYS